jgi:hypothetical protein
VLSPWLGLVVDVELHQAEERTRPEHQRPRSRPNIAFPCTQRRDWPHRPAQPRSFGVRLLDDHFLWRPTQPSVSGLWTLTSLFLRLRMATPVWHQLRSRCQLNTASWRTHQNGVRADPRQSIWERGAVRVAAWSATRQPSRRARDLAFKGSPSGCAALPPRRTRWPAKAPAICDAWLVDDSGRYEAVGHRHSDRECGERHDDRHQERIGLEDRSYRGQEADAVEDDGR